MTSKEILYIAFELSKKKWNLGFGSGSEYRQITIDAGDFWALQKAIIGAKKKFKLSQNTVIVSCYEAGRDGFWIDRFLLAQGIQNIIVDSSSIEVNRRSRKAKTDKIDAKKLYKLLLRYHGGEEDMWSIVRVPSVKEEDRRRRNREIDRIKKERKGHRNRIQGLLATVGISAKVNWKNFEEQIDHFTQWNGEAFPDHLKQELLRQYERFKLGEEQLKELGNQRMNRISAPQNEADKLVRKLYGLKAIGECTANVLVDEFFGWREFNNVREVGGCAGLTGTPYNSGDSNREQGISKSGNTFVRKLMVEISWGWLRFQPNSELSKWFMRRFGEGNKRMRKIGIVALARKLLVALWKYLKKGESPEGAAFKQLPAIG